MKLSKYEWEVIIKALKIEKAMLFFSHDFSRPEIDEMMLNKLIKKIQEYEKFL